MMNAEGEFIGQICHIEAAEEGGERFNKTSDNEARRSFSNLMLMCYQHHVITNDVDKYPVPILQEYKRQHEQKFSDPARMMMQEIKDWTQLNELTSPKTFNAFSECLSCGFDEDDAKTINDFIERFQSVPSEVRQFLGVLAQRAVITNRSPKLGGANVELLIEDIKLSCQLSERKLKKFIDVCQLHKFAYYDFEEAEVIILEDWFIWEGLLNLSSKKAIRMDRFTIDLQFHLLD